MDNQSVNRRHFLSQTGLLVLGGAAVSQLPAVAADSGSTPNPFAYDLSRISRTDPKLVQYHEITRFDCPGTEPRRLTVGPDQNLYLAGGHEVSVLNPQGNVLRQVVLQKPVGCVGVDGDGMIYAGSRNRVEVLDRDGKAIRSWDAPDAKAWFTGLCVDAEDVFVADAAQRAILRFDTSGKLKNRIGTKDAGKSIPGLIVPSPYLDVELAPDGLLRVNNPGRHRVEVYTRDGDLELTWGTAGGGIQGFTGCCNPIALALLPDGGCVTCEKGLPRVKRYTPKGEFRCVVAGTESFPENMRSGSARRADGMMGGLDAAADKERIYILDLVANHIRVMAPNA